MRILHGINPKLTNPATGKTFALPKFCTEEMQIARKMNRIAVKQIKDSVNLTFSKATPENLKRLTSDTIEATYSRVRWTNPKDGKVYNLLKEGETHDGKIKISILDKDGKFIKKAVVEPKKIVILDCSSPIFVKGEICQIPELQKLTHIDAVEIFARRNNPFAHYEVIDISTPPFGEIDDKIFIDELLRIKSEQNIDYINCSIGKDTFNENKSKTSDEVKYVAELLNQIASNGTRVIVSAGNGELKSKKAFDEILLNSKTIEGAGSLSPEGIISSFSASRNSRYTQHYELGEVKLTSTTEGINITGLSGTDIQFESKNPLIGKTLERINKFLRSFPTVREMQKIHGRKNGRKVFDHLFKKYEQYNYYVRQLCFSKDTSRAELYLYGERLTGTSFAAPTRTAKLSLNDMMEGII